MNLFTIYHQVLPPRSPYIMALALALSPTLLAGCGGSGSEPKPMQPSSTENSSESDTRMIGSDRRLAVRNECWFALDSGWQNNPNPNAPDQVGPMPANAMSNWRYIATDGNNNALRYVVNTYKGYTSNLIPGTDGSLRGISVDEWVRRFAADSYALNFGGIKGVGHGLQCPSFVSMVLYRALGGYQSGNMNGKRLRSDGSAKNAQPGDVVFTTGGTWGHVGICVRNTGSFITVVDSNFVGGDGNEVIGRHDVSYAAIGSTWQLYSGRGRWY